MNRGPGIYAVSLSLLIPIAAAGSQPVRPELLTLSQYCEAGDHCYFVDASLGKIVILRPEKKYDARSGGYKTLPARSNVVIAAHPGSRYTWQMGEVEDEQFNGPSVTVAKPGLESWTDRKGHVHTLAVLKRQLDYNFVLLANWRADCAVARCAIQVEGGRDVVLTPVRPTGILDRETLAVPFHLLQLQVHQLRMELTVRCQQETHRPCPSQGVMPLLSLEHWQALLSEAVSTFAEYERELARVPFEVPKPPSTILYNRVFPEDVYAGITGLDWPFVPKSAKDGPIAVSTAEYFERNDFFAIQLDDAAPENKVLESASVRAMTPARVENLRVLQKIAEEKILATRRYANELYPEAAE